MASSSPQVSAVSHEACIRNLKSLVPRAAAGQALAGDKPGLLPPLLPPLVWGARRGSPTPAARHSPSSPPLAHRAPLHPCPASCRARAPSTCMASPAPRRCRRCSCTWARRRSVLRLPGSQLSCRHLAARRRPTEPSSPCRCHWPLCAAARWAGEPPGGLPARWHAPGLRPLLARLPCQLDHPAYLSDLYTLQTTQQQHHRHWLPLPR